MTSPSTDPAGHEPEFPPAHRPVPEPQSAPGPGAPPPAAPGQSPGPVPPPPPAVPRPGPEAAGAHGRLGRMRQLARRTPVLVAIAAAVGCPAGAVAGGLGLFRWYGQGDLRDVAQVGLFTTLIVAGHGATTAWAWSRQLRPWETIITQVPYLLIYLVVLVWNFGYRFAPGYIAWAAVVLVALSWLTLWYLRGARQPRRAIVFLVALAMLAVGNGGAGVLVAWRQTNGFGLVGQGTPWDAMLALSSTSCLSGVTAYPSGSRILVAHCPSGPDATQYTGAYDEHAFGQQLCSDQPRAAFQVWWDRIRTYRVWITLNFGFSPQWQVTVDGKPAPMPRPRQISGSTADITLTVRLANAARPGDLPQVQKYPMRADKDNEQWHVVAKRTLLGGWKVCTIDVSDPIHVSAATG